jgi:hypothetical protein
MKKELDTGYFLLVGLGVATLFWLGETALHVWAFGVGTFREQFLPLDDPNELWMRGLITLLFIGFGAHAQRLVDRRRAGEREREKLIAELKESLEEVRALRGMIPICGHCKKIRNDKGYWEVLELYLNKHAHLDFTHGICPECAEKFYSEYI